jgi:hypothetical protein
MEVKKLASQRLENGLRLETSDESRQIAADRWCVKIRFSMTVPVADYYDRLPPEALPSLSEMTALIGEAVTYESVKERNFVSIDEKDQVIENLVATFISEAAPYLGRPSFPVKFILKTYRDRAS